MSQEVSLNETLNKIFTNPNFMNEVATSASGYEEAIAIVLKYYIASRDTNTHYSLEQIRELYTKFLEEHYEDAKVNTITHGFLTHAFNGYKKDRIIRFGFDYENIPEVQDDINYGRRIINELEELLGKSKYTQKEEESNAENNVRGNRVYLCAPGKEIVGYAMRYSPERLFEGPLSGQDEKIIVGETKQQYYFRLIEKKLREKYINTNSAQYKRGIEIGKKVVDYYCSKRPCIALVEIDKILDVTFWDRNVKNNNEIYMRDEISRDFNPKLTNFYEDYTAGNAGNILSDLVTFSSNIPRDAISVFEVMDCFELTQLRAKALGQKLGQIASSIEINKRATLGQMRKIIPNLRTQEELEELREQAHLRIEDILPEIEKQKNKLRELNIPCGSVQEIKDYYNSLIEEEEEIFNRTFLSRDGVTPKKSLRETIERLKFIGQTQKSEFISQSRPLDIILENDQNIIQDEHQYQSISHGVPHTRRVAFFASLIAERENLNQSERKLLFEIAKNHDIGRIDDFEDTEHGARSVKKISDLGADRVGDLFLNEDIEIMKFVIEHHSLSKRVNVETINRLRENSNKLSNLKTISLINGGGFGMLFGSFRFHDEDETDKLKETLKNLQDGNNESLENAIKSIYGEDFDLTKLTVEELDRMIKDSSKEIQRIEEQYPILKFVQDIDKLELMLRCFKDADKLDRVRLSPNGADLYEGLDASRLLLDSSKELEGLAYESLDKLLRVLDIERERKELEQFLHLQSELDELPQIDAQIDAQITRGEEVTEENLVRVIDQTVRKTDIREVFGNVKGFFRRILGIGEKQKSQQEQNGWEDEFDE